MTPHHTLTTKPTSSVWVTLTHGIAQTAEHADKPTQTDDRESAEGDDAVFLALAADIALPTPNAEALLRAARAVTLPDQQPPNVAAIDAVMATAQQLARAPIAMTPMQFEAELAKLHGPGPRLPKEPKRNKHGSSASSAVKPAGSLLGQVERRIRSVLCARGADPYNDYGDAFQEGYTDCLEPSEKYLKRLTRKRGVSVEQAKTTHHRLLIEDSYVLAIFGNAANRVARAARDQGVLGLPTGRGKVKAISFAPVEDCGELPDQCQVHEQLRQKTEAYLTERLSAVPQRHREVVLGYRLFLSERVVDKAGNQEKPHKSKTDRRAEYAQLVGISKSTLCRILISVRRAVKQR